MRRTLHVIFSVGDRGDVANVWVDQCAMGIRRRHSVAKYTLDQTGPNPTAEELLQALSEALEDGPDYWV